MADEFVDSSVEEINDLFESAANYIRHIAGSLTSENLLYLYARFKQSKDGECNTKKPGMFDFQGKQKWEAWKKLGDMSKLVAMKEYITYLTNLVPGWEAELPDIDEKKPANSSWVSVSTMSDRDPELDNKNKTVFDWCKEGDVNQMSKLLQRNNINVDSLDETGMALLHWACDRGIYEMVECLLNKNADINIQDEDEQTPLHYAVSCEHADVVKLLLSRGADKSRKDSDGLSPIEIETSEDIRSLLNGETT